MKLRTAFLSVRVAILMTAVALSADLPGNHDKSKVAPYKLTAPLGVCGWIKVDT